MTFQIRIEVSGHYEYYIVEMINSDKQCEYFAITGKEFIIVVRNNRPLLISKNLKHRRPNWILMKGNVSNQSTLEKMYEAIEDHFKKTS